MHHDRRSSTDTSRAGVRPTLPPPQQQQRTPTVVPNSYATSPTDARPPTPPTASTPPPGDMNDAMSAVQGPPPCSPSSPERGVLAAGSPNLAKLGKACKLDMTSKQDQFEQQFCKATDIFSGKDVSIGRCYQNDVVGSGR